MPPHAVQAVVTSGRKDISCETAPCPSHAAQRPPAPALKEKRVGEILAPRLYLEGDRRLSIEWLSHELMREEQAIRFRYRIPNANFGLNYDPSHLLWMQMDHLKPLRDFTSRLHHLHLKDAHVHRDRLDEHGILANPLMFHAPKLPGRGDIDWGAYFATLKEVGWTGPVVVEVEDKDYEGSLDDRKRSLVECREFLRKWVP